MIRWPSNHARYVYNLTCLVWFPCCRRTGWDRSMDRWITSRKWSNAFDRLGIAIYIGWPILDVVVVLLENKTKNKATNNGISCAFELPFLIQLGIDQQVDQSKQLYTNNYIYPTIFFNKPHHGHLRIDQQVGSIETTIYKQLHIAHYFFNEPHHEHKLFILQYSIHPPAALLYFLQTLESQLRSPCLVNQKSGI
jgi:hypothetical protein